MTVGDLLTMIPAIIHNIVSIIQQILAIKLW